MNGWAVIGVGVIGWKWVAGAERAEWTWGGWGLYGCWT